MLDVANVALLMWDDCLDQRTKLQLAADLGLPIAESRLFVSFVAGLHDLGKAAPLFQKQQSDLAQGLEDAGFHMGRGEAKPHGVITAHEAKAWMSEAAWRMSPAIAGLLAKIAGAHHGVFPQASQLADLGSDSLGGSEWRKVRSDIIQVLWRVHGDGAARSVDLSSAKLENPATVPVLSGLISVADWIGSNTDYFQLSCGTALEQYVRQSKARAHDALESLGWLPTVTAAPSAPFSEVFPFPPN